MFQINTSGNDIQSTPFKKSVLILIALMIFISLINTGLCTGPIDQIFIGWRDTTVSCDYYQQSCFGGSSMNPHRDGGAFFLIASSAFLGALYLASKKLLKIGKMFWSKKH